MSCFAQTIVCVKHKKKGHDKFLHLIKIDKCSCIISGHISDNSMHLQQYISFMNLISFRNMTMIVLCAAFEILLFFNTETG